MRNIALNVETLAINIVDFINFLLKNRVTINTQLKNLTLNAYKHKLC